jgi:hypothetical protein
MRGNIHNNGAIKNNNDNNTTPIFIGLAKKKHGHCKKKVAYEKTKCDVLKKIYLM